MARHPRSARPPSRIRSPLGRARQAERRFAGSAWRTDGLYRTACGFRCQFPHSPPSSQFVLWGFCFISLPFNMILRSSSRYVPELLIYITDVYGSHPALTTLKHCRAGLVSACLRRNHCIAPMPDLLSSHLTPLFGTRDECRAWGYIPSCHRHLSSSLTKALRTLHRIPARRVLVLRSRRIAIVARESVAILP